MKLRLKPRLRVMGHNARDSDSKVRLCSGMAVHKSSRIPWLLKNTPGHSLSRLAYVRLVSDLWPQVKAQCPAYRRIRGLDSAVCSQAGAKYPACTLSWWGLIRRSVIETSNGKAPLVLPFQRKSAYSWRQPNDDALVAQWVEHLITDQKVGGSSPFERAAAPLDATHRWGFCVFLLLDGMFHKMLSMLVHSVDALIGYRWLLRLGEL